MRDIKLLWLMNRRAIMKIDRTMLLVVSTLFLTACATSYQNTGLTGGYSETQLDENVFKVSFKGNGYTSRERASDFALLRSAELTLQSGYAYFVIVDEDSYTRNSTYTTPTTSNTTANVYGSGNYAYGSATTTTSGGQTYNISKPNTSNTILLFKEKPDNGFSYNAEFIYRELRQKYGVEDE